MNTINNGYDSISKLTKVSKQFLTNAKVAELLGKEVVYEIENNPNGFHSTFNSMSPDSIMIRESNQSWAFNPHINQEFLIHHMHMLDKFESGRAYDKSEYYVVIGDYKSFGESIGVAFLESFIPFLEDKDDSRPYSKRLLELIKLNA